MQHFVTRPCHIPCISCLTTCSYCYYTGLLVNEIYFLSFTACNLLPEDH